MLDEFSWQLHRYFLLEEHIAEIGAVNLRVTQGAGLILRGLIVQCGEGGKAVALDAHVVDVSAPEQPLVVGAMWRMARGTAFGLDRQMLERERSALIGVTLEADLVLRGVQLRLLGAAVVHVVTVTALDEAFVDTVVEGTIEVCAGVVVTTVAKLRGLSLQ